MVCDEPGCTGRHNTAYTAKADLCPRTYRAKREYIVRWYWNGGRWKERIAYNNRKNAIDQQHLEEVERAIAEAQV